VLLNGINIKEYDYGQYIALFSVVFQDFCLFPLELGANVASDAQYDKGRAASCLESAGFAGRLSAMPDGLDTVLYQSYDANGIQVSGGEAQKIALARALFKDAPFVILDEPTAALDPIAEYEVYSGFEQMIGSKTAVFISHRLSSCRFCNNIAVFDSGKLVQQGMHEELLADESGLYRKLWEAQAQYYVE
jgi:ATP-binding cassette subfamily B protein